MGFILDVTRHKHGGREGEDSYKHGGRGREKGKGKRYISMGVGKIPIQTLCDNTFTNRWSTYFRHLVIKGKERTVI